MACVPANIYYLMIGCSMKLLTKRMIVLSFFSNIIVDLWKCIMRIIMSIQIFPVLIFLSQ